MGKAFVAKLAKEGARDPEALAAWIGRKKHGKAFGKLAAKGRKKGTIKSAEESPEVRNARARVESADKRAAAARDRAGRANQSASDAYGRFAGGQPILSGHHSERSALRSRARADGQTRRAIAATEQAKTAEADVRKARADAQGAEMRADRSRPWKKDDFQAGDTVQLDRAGRPGESYQVVRANAKSVTVSRGFAGMDNKSIPLHKILSRTRDGQTTSDPDAGTPTAETERERGAHARLRESAARRQSARDNRPDSVQQNVSAMQRAAERYSSGFGGGDIRRAPDEKLVELARLVRTLSHDTDTDQLDRKETKALVDLQHKVLTEVRRRQSQRR